MALAQRLTNTGVLQVTNIFDETGVTHLGTEPAPLASNPTYSAQFTTSNYLMVTSAASAGFAFNADFTIEFWWNVPSFDKTTVIDFTPIGPWYPQGATSSNWFLTLRIQNSSTTPYWDSFIAGVAAFSSDPALQSYNTNTWYHFAMSKIGSTLRYFNNGTQIYINNSASFTIADRGFATQINGIDFSGFTGQHSGQSYGKLSNLRVVKGVGVYSGNFTVPTSPLSRIQSASTNIAALSGSETTLLTFQNSTIIDNSINNWSLTNYGSMVTFLDTAVISVPDPNVASRLTPDGILSINGTFDEVTLQSSGIPNLMRRQLPSSYQVYGSFDEISLAYSATPDKLIANEGDTITYTVNAPLLGSGTLYWKNIGSIAAADFAGGLVYGVTPLTWSGTATATLWTVTGVTQSATSGFGTGAVFSIRKNTTATAMATHGVLTVIPTSSGSGYTVGDTITIAGTSLGLAAPTNNLTITVGSDWFSQLVYSATITGTGMVTSGTGTANWTCPDGVYRISAVAVGGGGGGASGVTPMGGGGGALGYVRDIPVVPGTVYSVVAGIGGAATVDGGVSSFDVSLYVYGGGSGTNGGTAGSVAIGTEYFNGGYGGGGAGGPSGGGGGAGGYTSNGGDGGSTSNGTPSINVTFGGNSSNGGGGGSAGGGAGVYDSTGNIVNSSTGNGGGGGGVGLLGIFNLGIGGINLAGSSGAILGQLGTGGSGGANGGAPTATVGGAGGAYGGGGGGGSTTGGAGGAGAVRIIWNYPHGFIPSTTALTSITNTKLLTAQSATITDVTGINTITNVATVTAGNTTIPFAGTYSYQFNGTTQYLTIPSSSNFIFGATDDFTIEGWLYTSATTVNKGLYYKRSFVTSYSGVNFGTSTTTTSRFTLKVADDTGSTWAINDETAGTFTINTWFHFAITKTNGVIYLYLNGLLTRQYAHTTAIYDDGSVLNIGQDPGGAKWVGFISNLRVVKGTALYYPPSTIVNRNYPDYPPITANSGSVTITNGTGTIALPLSQDISQENVQSIQLQLLSGSTSGTLLATAPTVLIADTSRPLALPGGGQCWCAYPNYVSGPYLVYTGTPGVFTFTAPKGYTTVSVVCIGAGGGGKDNGGGGGGGGALSYIASTAVTAGTTYTVTCGAPGLYGSSPTAGGASSFASTVVANGGSPGAGGVGGAGGTVGAGTGFAGGAGGAGLATYCGGGGGGAGGYTVVGGVGGTTTGTYPTLTASSGATSATGGAGGGGGGSTTAGAYTGVGGGGGGTSPFGSVAVTSIAGIANAGAQGTPGRGGGGSGGNPTTTAFGVQLGQRGYTATPGGTTPYQKPNGGNFGGGGGGGDGNSVAGGDGGPGCVRIIWGTGRAYPATLTADRVSGFPASVGNPSGQQ